MTGLSFHNGINNGKSTSVFKWWSLSASSPNEAYAHVGGTCYLDKEKLWTVYTGCLRYCEGRFGNLNNRGYCYEGCEEFYRKSNNPI